MFKNKLIHILALFLVLFMVVCAVSAVSNHIAVGDVNNGNNTLKVSNNVIKESTLNTNLENKTVENKVDTVSNDSESNTVDTSFTQLAKDIENSVGVLNLTHDYTYDPTKDAAYNEGISITSDLIINGNNHIIDGSNTARVFNISSGTLTINDFTLTNCSKVTSCSNVYGGAIYNYGGSLIINDFSFINCSSYDGGAIYNYGGSLMVNSSSFIDNAAAVNNFGADNDGGAIYAKDASVSISNSTFNNNHAKTQGGAVWSNKGVNVINSLFTNNICNGDIITQCEGGAIYKSSLYSYDSINIENSSFIRNYADDYGGAVWSDDNVNVDNSLFENNTASDNDGGAINVWAESVSISNSTFNNNHANSEGGAVWSNKGTTVTNSLFTDNTCSGARIWQCEGGAIYSDADGVNIENSSFIRNYADDYGGAVWSDDNINVKNSLFEYNNADHNNGGALYADDYPVTLSNSTFIGNRAGDNGGVFYDNGMSDHDVVSDCNIHDNSAGKRGGAICMDSYYSHITLTGNAIYNNSAGSGEGLDVYTYGYFDTVNGNWWGTNDPDWGKHLLYEHRTFLSDLDHQDSNPLNYNPFNKLNTTIVASK